MKTIIEIQMKCYYRRGDFGYFRSLAGDLFRLRGKFEPGPYNFKIEINQNEKTTDFPTADAQR
jgi:hypothetical protein